MSTYIPLLVLLVLIAAIMRDDFALTLIYLFLCAVFFGWMWGKRSLAQVAHRRTFSERVFYGESVKVDLEVINKGWLPVVWTNIQEGLPVALSSAPVFERVITLGPRGEVKFSYTLEARKRGYYRIGPLFVSTGDILGLGMPRRNEYLPEYLTVYPKIVPLSTIKVPSHSPQGTLRHHQPIFEDPTRVFSKREYVAGDSLRRVDWKSTAATGRLQVKLFEPSISLETLIILDMNSNSYHFRHRIDSTELAVVIASSVAAWVTSKQQTVGLRVNGKDPFLPDNQPSYIPPRKGQAHLVRILESLARVEMGEVSPLVNLIQSERYQLPWGTTLFVITGACDDILLDELYQARRGGQNVILVLAGPVSHAHEISHRARHFGIPVVPISSERDMDIWRR